jgi:hypothetical protein
MLRLGFQILLSIWVQNTRSQKLAASTVKVRCNGENSGAQSVPNRGLEIANSRAVWYVQIMFSNVAKHMNPKRPIA